MKSTAVVLAVFFAVGLGVAFAFANLGKSDKVTAASACAHLASYMESRTPQPNQDSNKRAFDRMFNVLGRNCPAQVKARGPYIPEGHPPCRRYESDRFTCAARGDDLLPKLTPPEIYSAATG